jgi:hypothetical protein
LRVIRERAVSSDDDSINQRAKTMQMRETGRPVYVMRMSGPRRGTAVERLTDLTDDDEVIDGSDAQGPEYLLPWRRKVVG